MVFQISPSKLLVARCGRALELLNLNTPPDTPEFENTLFGSESHNVLHEINSYGDIINDIVLDSIISKCTTHALEMQRRYALKYIENFPYRSITLSEFECGIDENFKETSFDKALFRGRIDVVIAESERRVCIVDHKSSWQVFSPDTEQLRFYAWMIARIFPHFEEFVLSIYFLRYGQWERTDYALGRKAIANIERANIIAAEHAWNVQLGVPTPGKYCTFCKYAMSCPEAQKSVNVLTSQTDAIIMAQKLHVLNKQADEISGLLQNYAKEHGFIAIDGDFGYGYSEAESRTANPEDLLRLSKDNPDCLKALRVDMRTLKKLKIDIPITTRYYSKWGVFKKDEGKFALPEN